VENKFFSQEVILTNRLQRFVTRSKSIPFPMSAATPGAQSDGEKWNFFQHSSYSFEVCPSMREKVNVLVFV
jgi:hypothetical protein